MALDPILFVEDDAALAEEVVAEFTELFYPIVHVADGSEGLRQGLTGAYSLVILDIQLPGKNGFDICRELRAKEPLLPVIILTTRTSEVDRILGFELGADDYITKPFSIRELVARVRTKLNRQAAVQAVLDARVARSPSPTVRIGELELDLQRRTLLKCSACVDVTAKEFDLLFYLMTNPGRVFSREQLLQDVWEVNSVGYEEAVSALVYRLRAKIESDPSNPRYLLTVRGVGYSFAEPH